MGIAFAIGKFLLGGFQWLAIVAQCIMDFVKRNPWQAACIILACLSFSLWNGKRHVSAKLTDEKAAHRLTVTNYREASKRALEAAEAEKQRIETEHRRIARHADQNYDALRAQYRALLMRRTATANPGNPGETGLPGGPGAARVPENSASPAGFYISGSDGLKTADLGAYATACFKWAQDVANTH